MGEKEHRVEATLTPELYDKFLKVKEDLGLKWNANALRVIIAGAYRRIEKG